MSDLQGHRNQEIIDSERINALHSVEGRLLEACGCGTVEARTLSSRFLAGSAHDRSSSLDRVWLKSAFPAICDYIQPFGLPQEICFGHTTVVACILLQNLRFLQVESDGDCGDDNIPVQRAVCLASSLLSK